MPAPAAIKAPPLQAGQHVTVRTVHVGAIPATVERLDGSALTVALAVKDTRYARLIGQDIAVELSSGRGIYKHTGTLKGDRDGVLSIELSGVERIQRREFVRVPAHVTINVRGVDEPLGGETVTMDISGSGVRISDPWSLPLGLDVRVELHLPAGPPVTALGRVVRAAAENEKGIAIEGLGRADEDRLIRFIRERERQAMKTARSA
jgi:c-di-GMP-binding flagellar brake protein YcgR